MIKLWLSMNKQKCLQCYYLFSCYLFFLFSVTIWAKNKGYVEPWCLIKCCCGKKKKKSYKNRFQLKIMKCFDGSSMVVETPSSQCGLWPSCGGDKKSELAHCISCYLTISMHTVGERQIIRCSCVCSVWTLHFGPLFKKHWLLLLCAV